MTNEAIMRDLQMYAFRDKPAELVKILEGKVQGSEEDNIDRAVYTAALNKVKAVYDAGHYYFNFLSDTFLDIDYSLETTETYLEYSVEEIQQILKTLAIVHDEV